MRQLKDNLLLLLAIFVAMPLFMILRPLIVALYHRQGKWLDYQVWWWQKEKSL